MQAKSKRGLRATCIRSDENRNRQHYVKFVSGQADSRNLLFRRWMGEEEDRENENARCCFFRELLRNGETEY